MNKYKMKDLAPHITRQRLVIEGIVDDKISAEVLKNYLNQLSSQLEMKVLLPAISHKSEKYGESGWIHWETSGAHFYAWDHPIKFFSVDIYTCKEFDVNNAVEFTRSFFNPSSLEYKSF